MFEVPVDLPAEAMPLSWLLGVWEGRGVVSYAPDADSDRVTEFEFGQRVAFTDDGLPAVNYNSFTWRLDAGATPLNSEMGYWRLARPSRAADPGPGLLDGAAPDAGLDTAGVSALQTERGLPLEVSVLHADGVSELYVGWVNGPRIDLATDTVMRSQHARRYDAATRMYGLVEHRLMWTWDAGMFGNPVVPHASAVLEKVSGPGKTVR